MNAHISILMHLLDISAYEAAGAEVASVTALKDELKKPRAEFKTAAPVSTRSGTKDPVKTYENRDSVGYGNGAFATRGLARGDFILEEKPILAQTFGNDDGATPHQIYLAAQQLSPKNLVKYLSLPNSWSHGDILSGIWGTNAFTGGGICVEASSFNHSCLPNARYSWHEKSGRLRIIALTDIAPGEEVFVSYILGRNNYGSTRAQRQQRLLGFKYFLCSCSLCSAPPDVVRASDKRRQELLSLWNNIPNTTSPNMNLFIRAMKLLKEEKFHADADDFAVDAAAFCSMFSDWDATKDWAKIAYEARRDEFGEDSDHTIKAKAIWLNPVRNPGHLQAGKMPKKKLGRVSNLLK